jgi:hypothetical protein
MSDETEFSPDPTVPTRPSEQPNFEKNVIEPSHKMPPFIDRHETAADIQRRGHLRPEEWDVRFDRNNQPTNHPDNQSTS